MKYILLIIFLLGLISCDCQNKKNTSSKTVNKDRTSYTLKKNTMEYFNKNQYKNLSTNDMGFYILKNGDLVQVIDKTDNHGYAERIHQSNSPFGFYKEYNMDNSIKKVGDFFYGLNINKWKEYDEAGKLIEETNYETPFKFTIKELIEKIKKEYNVNLEDKSQGGNVGRNGENGNFYYEVELASKENPQKINYILIDGVTGETQFKTHYYMKGNATPPFDQYLETLKKK